MVDVQKESRREGTASDLPPGSEATSVAEELRQLVAAIRQLATTEIAYQSTRFRLMGKAAAWCAAGGGLALALLFFVLMALVVGLLLALAPILGAWGALGAVIGGLLMATLVAGLISWLALRRLLALLRGKDRT